VVNQREHHQTRTFREEVIMFLKHHGMAFGEAMLE
jgi:hypothetical protein